MHHGIYETILRRVHPISESCMRQQVRTIAHGFHAAGYYHIRIACQNHFCSHIHAIKTRSAYHVHSNCRAGNRKTCFDGSLPGRILSQTCLDDIAHIYMIHLLRLQPGTLHCFSDYCCSEIHCRDCAQFAAHLADRCSACACQYNFLSHRLSFSFFLSSCD